jgi:glutathione S-transferase
VVANHFYRYAPTKIEYAINRYQNETKRLYQVLNDRLAAQEAAGQGLWIVGGKFSIADISCFSWINWAAWAGVETDSFKELERWLKAIQDREAVERGVNVPEKFELRERMKSKESADAYAKKNSAWIMQGMKEDEEKHK